VRRVRLIAGAVNAATLSSRQRRQIEIPFEAGEAFDMVDAAIRELPGSEVVEESARDSLRYRPACAAAPYTDTGLPRMRYRFLPSRGRTRFSPPSRRMARRAA
jgi:hypothetical protein